MKIQFEFAMTRRQKVATSVWCGLGSALFIVPSTLLPGAEVSAHTAAAGVGIPAAVAVVFWLAKNLADQHDRNAKPHESARRGAAEVRAAEREAATTRVIYVRPGDAIEGEVLPR